MSSPSTSMLPWSTTVAGSGIITLPFVYYKILRVINLSTNTVKNFRSLPAINDLITLVRASLCANF
jgi:hypothetical protein